MRLHSFAQLMLLVLADLCFAAIGVMIRQWILLALLLGTAGAWLILRRRPSMWAGAILLAAQVLLSAFATILRGSVPLGFLGLSCSLAAWELRDFSAGAGDSPPDDPMDLEQSHLRAVALMVLCTIAVGTSARLLALELSFWLAGLLTAVAVGSVAYLVHATRKGRL